MKDQVVRRLVEWAEGRVAVRALLLTSTRANPDAPVDAFSDYDVILVVTDVRPFFESRRWLEDFGAVLVLYRDPLKSHYGLEKFAYITQYKDGTKIDFTLWPVEILPRVADAPELPPELDVGYAVLLDKDALTERLPPPTYRAHVPSPPSAEVYGTLVETFFHEATYVAKHLQRDDLMPAKYNLDHMMKFKLLRRVLEWRIEIDHDWSVKPGAYGKGLKKRLPPQIWSALEGTYVGAGERENWDALFETIELFRQVALQVGRHLGYAYPHELHRRVLAYLERVQRRDRHTQ